MARRLAAIMFTDLAGYTQVAQADEAGALRLLQEQERLVRPVLATHRGRKVSSMGTPVGSKAHVSCDGIHNVEEAAVLSGIGVRYQGRRNPPTRYHRNWLPGSGFALAAQWGGDPGILWGQLHGPMCQWPSLGRLRN